MCPCCGPGARRRGAPRGDRCRPRERRSRSRARPARAIAVEVERPDRSADARRQSEHARMGSSRNGAQLGPARLTAGPRSSHACRGRTNPTQGPSPDCSCAARAGARHRRSTPHSAGCGRPRRSASTRRPSRETRRRRGRRARSRPAGRRRRRRGAGELDQALRESLPIDAEPVPRPHPGLCQTTGSGTSGPVVRDAPWCR